MESNLKIYSLGIVVEDKPVGTDIALIAPIEALNVQQAGFIKDQSKDFKGNLKDTSEQSFQAEMKASNYLRAKWLPFGHSNRITAPDVYKNETVLLFKYENVDEYYWTTIFREPKIRRQETVLYSFSNLKSGLKEFDKNTSYWLEVDTRKKLVTFHTSDNDGEHTKYDVIFNTKEGYFIVKDSKGDNFIQIKSNTNTIRTNSLDTILETANNQILMLAGNLIHGEALEIRFFAGNGGFIVESDNQVLIRALTNIDLISKIQNINLTAENKSVTINANKDVTINGKDGVFIDGNPGVVISGGKIYLNGDVVIKGNLTIQGKNGNKGAVALDANLLVDGTITTTGGIDSQGNVTAPNLTSGD